jgi:hypothetical protein
MDNSLTIFSRGSQMLAEANTIQKARDLKDLALTAADWARRVGAGEAAITLAKAYAFEAEHRMGEMLKETERANVSRDKKKAESKDTTPPPTLAEIGISKDESARAQKVAALPDETFEELKQGKITINKALKNSDISINRKKDAVKIPFDIFERLSQYYIPLKIEPEKHEGAICRICKKPILIGDQCCLNAEYWGCHFNCIPEIWKRFDKIQKEILLQHSTPLDYNPKSFSDDRVDWIPVSAIPFYKKYKK